VHDLVFDGGHEAGRAALVLEGRACEERGEAFAALCSLAQHSRTKALEALIRMKKLPEDLWKEAENQGLIQRRGPVLAHRLHDSKLCPRKAKQA